MNLKLKSILPLLTTLIIAFVLFLFIGVKLSANELTLSFSFFINAVLAFVIIFKNIKRKTLSIGANSIAIFVLLFFIVAPVMQVVNYVEGAKMVNNFSYNLNLAIIANIQISLFLITFILIYFYTGKINSVNPVFHYSEKLTNYTVLLSIAIFILFARYVVNSLLMYDDNNESIIKGLVLRKSLFMVPVAAFSLYFTKEKRKIFPIILIVFIILFLKNPIAERRNAVGPLYLTLVFFAYSFLYRSNFKSFIFIFTLFSFLFPLSSLITNSNLPIFQRIENLGSFLTNGFNLQYFQIYFNTLHYDAWSNICASIAFVDKFGISAGLQFLGGLLFFVPRFIWPYKPIGSGHMLANEFLIPFHNLWLSNISCPIISEGYLNFGLVGVILSGILLALFLQKIDSWLVRQDAIYKIFGIYSSFWLFYLMRGDFMSSWAYLCGAYIGIILLPKTMNYLYHTYLKLSKKDDGMTKCS